jgi:hypothetical protein
MNIHQEGVLMSRLVFLVLVTSVGLTFSAAPRGVRTAWGGANGRAPAAAVLDLAEVSDTPGTLQSRLEATDEEWAVIYPKLERIAALRNEITATAETATIPTRTRMFNGPAGGTSLDAPVVNGSRSSRFGSREFPFDPQKAPGASGSSLLTTIAGGVGRALSSLVKPNAPSSVEVLLVELRTLADSTDTPGWQLLDKLGTLRAARAKAIRELTEAQKDIMPLLCTEQIATLVALGYLD